MTHRTLITFACLAFPLSAVAAAPGSAVVPKFERVIPNIPGKSLLGQPVRHDQAGESWDKDAGAHPVVPGSASATRPLVIPDARK